MAKNWTVNEVTNELFHGVVNVNDYGRRYPLATLMLNKAVYGDGDAIVEIMNALSFITMNKLEKSLKENFDGFESTDETETSEEVENEQEIKEVKSAKAPIEIEDNEYAKMKTNEVYELVKNAGLLKEYKAAYKNPKRADLIEFASKNLKDVKADEAETEDWDDEEEVVDYSKMSPKELYTACKEKGIKVKAGQKAEYYLELLQPETEEADDDWDDEEEVEEIKPSKTNKPNKSKAKVEEDDDDDWEI